MAGVLSCVTNRPKESAWRGLVTRFVKMSEISDFKRRLIKSLTYREHVTDAIGFCLQNFPATRFE